MRGIERQLHYLNVGRRSPNPIVVYLRHNEKSFSILHTFKKSAQFALEWSTYGERHDFFPNKIRSSPSILQLRFAETAHSHH